MQDRRQSPAAFRRTGVLQLEQVDVQVIESPGRLDDGVFAGLAAQILPRPRVDEVLDDHRDAGGAAVADDLVADGESLGDQVRLTRAGRRAVGPQLDEELEGVTALVQDPLGIQGRVAVRARLALVAAPLGRFGRDEQPAVRGQRLRLGYGRDAVGRVGQQAGGGGRQDAGDVGLRDAQVVVAGIEADGGEHAAQRVPLVHGDDGEHVVVRRDVVQGSGLGGVCHCVPSRMKPARSLLARSGPARAYEASRAAPVTRRCGPTAFSMPVSRSWAWLAV